MNNRRALVTRASGSGTKRLDVVPLWQMSLVLFAIHVPHDSSPLQACKRLQCQLTSLACSV